MLGLRCGTQNNALRFYLLSCDALRSCTARLLPGGITFGAKHITSIRYSSCPSHVPNPCVIYTQLPYPQTETPQVSQSAFSFLAWPGSICARRSAICPATANQLKLRRLRHTRSSSYNSNRASVAFPARLSFALPISPVIQRPISAIFTISTPVSHPRLCNRCRRSSVATLPVAPLLCHTLVYNCHAVVSEARSTHE